MAKPRRGKGSKRRRADIEALQEQINKAREFESAIASMEEFIQSLRVGSLGPGTPAGRDRARQVRRRRRKIRGAA